MDIRHTELEWRQIGIWVGISVGAAATTIALASELRHLALLGLYEIPCQLVSLPLEPYLLYAATLYDVWLVTLVTTLGCAVGGVLDYLVFGPMLAHGSMRPRYENRRWFHKALALFRKAPFWTLVLTGYTPIPFAPFKLLSIAAGYPVPRYVVALVLARAPRYYLVAWLGYVIQPPGWSMAVLAGVLLAIYVVVRWKRKKAGRAAGDPESLESDGA